MSASEEIKEKLCRSIVDAQLMLSCAAQNGTDISAEAPVITMATQKLDTLSESEQTKFWIAFQTVSAKIKPATPNSLRATGDINADELSILPHPLRWLRPKSSKNPGAPASRAVVAYTRGTIVTLLLMLCIQIYWVFGTTTLKENQRLTVKKETLDSLYDSRSRAVTEQEGVIADDQELNLILPKIENANTLLEANFMAISRLEFWHTLSSLVPVVNKPMDSGTYESKAATANIRLKRFECMLSVIYSYFLPLFYGLLGSLAFVLRELREEIRKMAFTVDSRTNHMLRCVLGILAGLSVGWFLGQDKSGHVISVSSLSPLALSFLAGYSVELFFSAMDRIIGAFSTKGASTTA